VKKAFGKLYGRRTNGMLDMLNRLNLELEGRHHSGIDDCKNISRVVQRMLEDGWVVSKTWVDLGNEREQVTEKGVPKQNQ
jgi:inhibitor of KinA sporulation pathway (predicted exonuclease)